MPALETGSETGSEPRRAVIVAPWFGVNSGGAEVALLKIAEGLVRLGYAVEVYTTQSVTPYTDWLDNPVPQDGETYAGFAVRRFAVDAAGFARFSQATAALVGKQPMQQGLKDAFFRYGMTSTPLIAALQELPQDVLIIGGPYYQALIHCAVAALPGRIFVMPAFHDEPPFQFPAVNRLVRDARALMFLTETEKTLTIRYHGDAMTRAKFETPVLSLPYITPTVAKPASEPSLVKRLFDSYAVYVGRVDAGKNVRTLMDWHHSMNIGRQDKGAPVIPLLMMGPASAPVLPSPYVKYLGFVPAAEKQALIADALCLVNLSLNESFSFVLFEAWQRDVPVIVHRDCAVMQAHIEVGKGGYACQDQADYARAVTQLEKPDQRRIRAENGRAYADRVCSADGFIDRLAQITGLAA